jgi:hypothetical protein
MNVYKMIWYFVNVFNIVNINVFFSPPRVKS